MRSIFLFFLLFTFALPARADDVQGVSYNAVTKQFQGQTRSNGLIGFQQGVIDGSSACTGCIGETISAVATLNSTTVHGTAIDATAAVTLTPGVWLIVGTGAGSIGTPTGFSAAAAVVLRNSTDNVDVFETDFLALAQVPAAVGDVPYFGWNVTKTVAITSTKAYKVQLKTVQVSGSPPTAVSITSRSSGPGLYAIRIH